MKNIEKKLNKFDWLFRPNLYYKVELFLINYYINTGLIILLTVGFLLNIFNVGYILLFWFIAYPIWIIIFVILVLLRERKLKKEKQNKKSMDYWMDLCNEGGYIEFMQNQNKLK